MTKHREIALKLLFLLFAIILTLAVGEVAVRVISSHTLIYNIEMAKYAKALKQRDPKGEVSHVHVPSRSAHLMGVDVTLNSLGHRSHELSKPKTPGTRRILVVGASMTMGWGVSADRMFTSVLEERLNRTKPFGPDVAFEIANAGVGNYNTYFELKLFQRQYPVVKPDLVVVQYVINDAQPRSMGRNNWLLQHSLLADYFFDRFQHLRFAGGTNKDLFTFYSDLYGDNSDAWKQSLGCLAAIRDIVQKDGVPLVIMIAPDIHDLSPDTPFRGLYAKMESAFQKLDIPTINSFDEFQKHFGTDVPKLWIQSDDPHPNARGHALMADILYDYLIEADPLKLKKSTRDPSAGTE
jgi:lysophospholipase L1-like esterase